MPILINEVIAEIEPTAQPETEAEPAESRAPSDLAEFEIMRRLTLLQERRARLAVD
jgi:hypothetical protein